MACGKQDKKKIKGENIIIYIKTTHANKKTGVVSELIIY